MNETEIKQEGPKSVISVILTLTDDGKRIIAYQSDTQDKDKIHLAHVRELLQWAITNVNDSIVRAMIKNAFNDAKTQLVKPGFRPMQRIMSVFGGNGNDA